MAVFFFSSRRRHTRSLCDWSSDVCSSDLMKDVVRQENIGGGAVAGAGKFAVGESAFAAHINFAGWGEWCAKSLAEVHKIDPSAVAILPKRSVEIRHFCLKVHAGSANAELSLIDGEAIVPDGESGGGVEWQGNKTFVGKVEIFPFEITRV